MDGHLGRLGGASFSQSVNPAGQNHFVASRWPSADQRPWQRRDDDDDDGENDDDDGDHNDKVDDNDDADGDYDIGAFDGDDDVNMTEST